MLRCGARLGQQIGSASASTPVSVRDGYTVKSERVPSRQPALKEPSGVVFREGSRTPGFRSCLRAEKWRAAAALQAGAAVRGARGPHRADERPVRRLGAIGEHSGGRG